MFINRKLANRMFAALVAVGMMVSGCATTGELGSGAADGQKAADKDGKAAKITVQGVSVAGNGDRIVIATTGPVRYTAFKLTEPARLVLDMPSVSLANVASPIAVNNELVKDITVVDAADGMDIGRVIITLSNGIETQVRSGENVIVVSLSKGDVADQTPQSAIAKASELAVEPVPGVESAQAAPAAAQPPVEEKPAESKAEPSQSAVKVLSIRATADGAGTVVSVATDGAVGNYNAFVLDSPARIVLDIWGVKNAVGKTNIKLKEKFVKSVRIGSYPDKVRLVIDSSNKKFPPYTIRKEGNSLVLALGEAAVPEQASQQKAAPVEAAPVPVAEAPVTQPAPAAAAEPAAPTGPRLTNLDFRKINGAGRLTVASDAKIEHQVSESADGMTVVVDIKGATIPEALQRTLDATKLKTVVATISSFQEATAPVRNVRVLVKLSVKAKYDVKAADGAIAIDFSDDEAAAAIAASEEKKADQQAKTMDAAAAVDAVSSDEAELAGTRKAYKGRKIDLDMMEANVPDVLRLLAEVSDLNIIASDEVKGTISLRLKDVPWDQAFDIILKSKELGMVREGNVIRVAPAVKLRQERDAVLASKKAQEKLENLDIRFIPISYATATELEPQVKGVLTDRGSVASEKRTNTLIVKDIKLGIEAAVALVKRLDTQIPQVLIEARIVEASSSFARDLGIQWGVDTYVQGDRTRSHTFGSTTQVGSAAVSPAYQQGVFEGDSVAYPAQKTEWPFDAGATNYAVNLPASGVAGTLGALGIIIGQSGTNPMILDLRLSAGESAGRLKTISRPRITTMDNKEAKIEQGESIPFSTTSSSGTSTTFVDANLSLTVTPHITPDGSVLMKIKASRNSIGTFRSSSGAPSINKKESSTEVLVVDGETTVIGGIVISDKNETERGIPYLKEIPLFGWLFKSKSIADTQTELLIFITPTIIKDKQATPAAA